MTTFILCYWGIGILFCVFAQIADGASVSRDGWYHIFLGWIIGLLFWPIILIAHVLGGGE